jgi:hypothetical protein
VIPTVQVDLGDGKTRNLRYDLNAFCDLERVTGKSITEFSSPSITDVRALVWAGLLHEEPGLTEREVGALLGMADVQDVMGLVAEALGLAMPEAEANGNSPLGKAKEKAPTG